MYFIFSSHCLSLSCTLLTSPLYPLFWHRPFKFWWWVWLTMTGIGLGVTVSSKWVGLFTIATIGTSTIINLWELLGDLRVNVVSAVIRLAFWGIKYPLPSL